MPPTASGSQKTKASSQSKPNVVQLLPSTLATQARSGKRLDPLTAFSNSAIPKKDGATPSTQGSVKGKERAKNTARVGSPAGVFKDDRLWVDMYEPTTEAALAVHKRKVDDVRRWLSEAFDGGPSGKLSKYRRILVLTGPAGTGKTTTLKILSRELGFEIVEWRNAVGEVSYSGDNGSLTDNSRSFLRNVDDDYESSFSKFETFIQRASHCKSLFSEDGSFASSSQHTLSTSSQTSAATNRAGRRIILLEDLPNILHTGTQVKFHSVLENLVAWPTAIDVPIVLVISDAGVRGEASDERMADGIGWGRDRDGAVDIRTALSRSLLGGPYVTQISFNPVAPTILHKALLAMLDTHFALPDSGMRPTKEVLDAVVQTANGDIRSAIMTLQFTCILQPQPQKGRKRKATGKVAVMEAVTRREQSLSLFHMLGKVLYNKRKGDPPGSSASAKDIQKEKDTDSQIKDPPKLPLWLEHHDRRSSRVDIDALYADSPVDSSLFSLYLQQNYTQFCDDVDQCGGVADWLSWVDSSGGEAWYQANPYQFHLLSLGARHSLPSPVTRRKQTIYKPEFFAVLAKERVAHDSVHDVRDWVLGDNNARKVGAWGRVEVATELGGVLKALEISRAVPRPPPSHRVFSSLNFVKAQDGQGGLQLGERDEDDRVIHDEDSLDPLRPSASQSGGWLETDDIEDFD